MYENYLNSICRIVRKIPNNTGGLSTNNETFFENISCRMTSPNQRDLKLIDKIKGKNKQIYKLYLKGTTDIQNTDSIEIGGLRYEVIYTYKVPRVLDIHHIKCLITTI